MAVDREAALVRKFVETSKLLNVYLNHFPRHEKYALCNRIRNSAYEVFDLITEGQKRYHKKTTLTQLDIAHEQLRMQLFLAYELGYFKFTDGRTAGDAAEVEAHRWQAISKLVDMMMLFAELPEPTGIPIGNLLSQIFALIYLNALDHFVKRELKVKLYCRYVDDFILFNLTREQCLDYKARIEAFLRDELHLELSKWTMAKTKRGVNFVGYRTWRSKRFIRKYSLFKFRRAVKKGKVESVTSILGHAKHTHSLGYMWRTIQEVNPDLAKSISPKTRRFYPPKPPRPAAAPARN